MISIDESFGDAETPNADAAKNGRVLVNGGDFELIAALIRIGQKDAMEIVVRKLKSLSYWREVSNLTLCRSSRI